MEFPESNENFEPVHQEKYEEIAINELSTTEISTSDLSAITKIANPIGQEQHEELTIVSLINANKSDDKFPKHDSTNTAVLLLGMLMFIIIVNTFNCMALQYFVRNKYYANKT